MPIDDYRNLLALSSIYPLEADRADIRSAIVACAAANAMGGKAKVADFIPHWLPKTVDPELGAKVFAAWCEGIKMRQQQQLKAAD